MCLLYRPKMYKDDGFRLDYAQISHVPASPIQIHFGSIHSYLLSRQDQDTLLEIAQPSKIIQKYLKCS